MTYKEAVVLAKTLKALSDKIISIELFGSTLHNGRGRDADFVVLVSEDMAKHWWSSQRESIRVRWPDFLYEQRWIVKKFIPFAYTMAIKDRKKKRLEATAEIVGISLEELADSSGAVPDFEMFLLPVTWRVGKELDVDQMEKVTNLIHDSNTLGFLKRVANDAATVV